MVLTSHTFAIAGLVPAIHDSHRELPPPWTLGTSPRVTVESEVDAEDEFNLSCHAGLILPLTSKRLS
jgi:hypothetical protein